MHRSAVALRAVAPTRATRVPAFVARRAFTTSGSAWEEKGTVHPFMPRFCTLSLVKHFDCVLAFRMKLGTTIPSSESLCLLLTSIASQALTCLVVIHDLGTDSVSLR